MRAILGWGSAVGLYAGNCWHDDNLR